MRRSAIRNVQAMGADVTYAKCWDALDDVFPKYAVCDVERMSFLNSQLGEEQLREVLAFDSVQHFSLERTTVDLPSAKRSSLLFPNLESFTAIESSFDAELLKGLKHSPNLKTIILFGPQINDAHLTAISECVTVTDVYLRRTSCSPLGIERLRRMRGLTKLTVEDSLLFVTADANGVFAGFPNLEVLSLANSPVSDNVLEPIADMPRLVYLNLRGTNITDRSLRFIVRVSGLRELDLGITQVGDNGAAHIVELRELERLYMDSTELTDNSINDFAKMKSLRHLDIGNTQISDASVQRLRIALPSLSIDR